MNARRIGTVLGLLLMAVCIYLLNRWCVPFGDDWLYALEGENTVLEGTAHRVSGFADVVRIQLNDYAKGPNGRIFLHSVVVAFCALDWHGIFDVLNAGMWFLLVCLVMKESGVRNRFLSCAALVFTFLWQAETCCVNAAYAVNYLWMACATIVFRRLWRRAGAVWMIPVSFLFGWSHEAFSLPMVAALGAACLVQTLQARRFAWSGVQTFAYVALVMGTLGCAGGHFISGRTVDPASKSFLFLLVLAVWPAVLLGCTGFLLWRSGCRWRQVVFADLEWWLYLAASGGMFVLIGRQGLRLGMPMLLAALVLCLKHREAFSPLRRFVPALVAFSLVWLVAGAGVQHRQAVAFEEMVDVYCRSTQGLTFRRPVATGLLDGTVSAHALTPYFRGILRHMCEKDVPPIVLSPSLYEEVMRPSASNRTYFVGRQTRTGWKTLLPGRLGRMFPGENFHEGLPADKVEIDDPSGHRVTFCEKGRQTSAREVKR